jgi:uncharacterized membrane protein YhaH (DUF805 family)
MNFIQAIKSGFSNYVNFSGRAIRSEYWYWVLFGLICEAVAAGIDAAIFNMPSGGPIYDIFALAVILPSLALTWRRLHDLDRSAWWVLLLFIPLIGAIVIIVWFCSKGTPGPNRFGPDRFAELGLVSPRPAT